MNIKKIIKNVVVVGLVFLLCIAMGVIAWYFSKQWRGQKSAWFLISSDRYLEEGNANSLWELEKAYVLGMDYNQYRIKRAVAKLRLKTYDAEGEVNELLDRKIGSDLLYFWYGKYLFDHDDFDSAENYLLKVSENFSGESKEDYLTMMAFLSGRHASWDKAGNYLSQIKIADSEKVWRMQAVLAVVEDDQTNLAKAEVKKILDEKGDGVLEKNGDLFVLGLANLANKLGLAEWARALMDNYFFESVENKYIFLLYGQSYLVEGKCDLAMPYLQKAKSIDPIDSEILKLTQEVGKCEK